MAIAYRAVTRIEHGMGEKGVKFFEPGDIVEDLDEKTMRLLWDSGALEEATVVTTLELEQNKTKVDPKQEDPPKAPNPTDPQTKGN